MMAILRITTVLYICGIAASMCFIIFTVFLVKSGFGFSSCERRLPAQQLFGKYFDLYIMLYKL